MNLKRKTGLKRSGIKSKGKARNARCMVCDWSGRISGKDCPRCGGKDVLEGVGKYNAKPCYDDTGRHFGSQGERDRSNFLRLLQKGGVIKNLEWQPRITLLPEDKEAKAGAIKWKVDFFYIDDRGIEVWEDYKPRPETSAEEIYYNLWKRNGPGVLRITKGTRGEVKKEIMGHGPA